MCPTRGMFCKQDSGPREKGWLSREGGRLRGTDEPAAPRAQPHPRPARPALRGGMERGGGRGREGAHAGAEQRTAVERDRVKA